MTTNCDNIHDEHRPRVIIWQLTQGERSYKPPGAGSLLTQHECLLIIDSIARLSKSIVVLTGSNLIRRADLHEIVGYGSALGLKMIIELKPEEISPEVLEKYRQFGPRILRLVLNGCVVEDIDTRFRQSPAFSRLEKAVRRMKDSGFELHFSLNIDKPDIRALGYNLDYAFRSAAKGLFCHLRFNVLRDKKSTARRDGLISVDEFIYKISELKPLLPSNMYFSPQCVKYTPCQVEEHSKLEFLRSEHPKWTHSCLAGKTFAFLTETGKVYLCGGMHARCGDLRGCGYDFRRVWMESEVFKLLRDEQRSCTGTRKRFKKYCSAPGSRMITKTMEVDQ